MTNIALVGEAWGAEEETLRLPFVGPSGYCLNKMLEEAGIRRADCFVTNTLNLRPPNNDIEALCAKKNEVRHDLPPLKQGKYLRDEFLPELDRLYAELKEVRPIIIVALGNTASWALLGDPRISKIRGTIAPSPYGKVLPTYHPAAVLRGWDLRPTVVFDLRKALRESEFPEVRRPAREIWIEPTLDDMEYFYERHLVSAERIAFDIETAFRTITCIGFSSSPHRAIVVPFFDPRRGGNYWPTSGDEIRAWDWVRKVLGLHVPKVTQNGIYDVTYLWREHGYFPAKWTDDTMLLHHALYPEAQKGLGYLGSIYTNEPAWKTMRPKGTLKRGDE